MKATLTDFLTGDTPDITVMPNQRVTVNFSLTLRPPLIIHQPQRLAVKAGVNVLFTVAASGGGTESRGVFGLWG